MNILADSSIENCLNPRGSNRFYFWKVEFKYYILHEKAELFKRITSE